MELVLTLLVVGLLVVLPIAVFLLVIGGLVYSIYRAIIGDKKDVERSTPAAGVRPETSGGAEIPTGRAVPANGIKSA